MNNEDTISKFLLLNPEFTSITRRVWTMGHCVMGEIQANVLSKDFLPMDLLRAKLAMFGATKFDPRSDRWVQVTFFQSAPLLDEIHANEWLFPLLEKNKDDKLDFNATKICVSQTELKTLCSKAFNGLKLKAGEAEVIAKMVLELELVGLRGVDHFIEALEHLKDDDILFFIADHGCDPTWPGNDHTREYVPIIAYHNNIGSVNLGERSTFADLGQTIAEMFKLTPMGYGQSFLNEL